MGLMEVMFKDIEFLNQGKMGKFLEMNGGHGCKTLNILNAAEFTLARQKVYQYHIFKGRIILIARKCESAKKKRINMNYF